MGTFSDVEFKVGPECASFLGLKAIFARASEVFSKMFFEAGFSEQNGFGKTIVHVTDMRPVAFEQLRRWVYDTDIQLAPSSVLDVLDAARRYMVEDLDLKCRRWIAS